jgi:hypothetical protein
MKVFSRCRIGTFALVTLCVLAIAAGLFVSDPLWLFHRGQLRTGNEIIARVDAFRASHGRLPENLEEIGINDPDLTVYYRKVNDEEYLVWFGRYSVGESEIFDSRTKKWQ